MRHAAVGLHRRIRSSAVDREMTSATWRRLEARRIERWPSLGWVAELDIKTHGYRLFHGRHVEVRNEWAVEGIWDGAFTDADFDRTSQVFGSGFRVRGDTIIFVPPATTTERLWYTNGSLVFVSNSLPLLMAASGFRLRRDVGNYPSLCAQTPESPDEDAAIPAQPAPVHVLTHHNLAVANGGARRMAKPRNPGFGTFRAYSDFLFATAGALAENVSDADRTYAIRLLTTISRGYDSPAAAVVARSMGCRHAVTIAEARSTIPRSDSGREVARQLGLRCTTYRRAGRGSEHEISFWAALGHPQDEHFAVFDLPGPVCVLFTGIYGGNIWSIGEKANSPFRRSDWTGLGFGEYRLSASIIHCPVPYWGADRYRDIQAIGASDSMSGWIRHGGAYDRPIPRRLIEEAGVDPEVFGVRKSATQYDDVFLWPRRKELAADYRAFLRSEGISRPPVRFARLLSAAYGRFLFPIEVKLLGRSTPRDFWKESQHLLFVWANERLAERYTFDKKPGALETPPPGRF